MAEKIWKYRNKEIKRENIERISKNLNIPPVIAVILLNRGINEADMPSFLAKTIKNIRNPMLMNDMDKAVSRILNAINKHEKIVIYGDYDVDGITSTTLMMDFLSSIGADVDFYIPDRKDEGYGINIKAVNKLIKQGVRLLITVDCGITALGEVSFAKLLGMDVIVTDHHTCKDRLPNDAYAVLNPKRPDSSYPFDSLAGVGVAFKLVLAIAMALKINTTQCFYKYIDIVTIGTIADVVPLIDENRIMVDKGIKALKNSARPGIRALLKVSGADKRPITSSSVAFALAPRLNASGRLGTASTSVKLLLSQDEKTALEIAAELDCENKERQMTEQTIYSEAMDMIASDINFEKKKVIVLAKKDWHHGVIGIVASRINDLFYKPCILISLNENGEGKGSGRSIPAFNLFDALSYCEDTLTDFGGHSAAAGLNINISSIEDFTKKINKYADDNLTSEDMIPTLDIDCPINEHDITLDAAKLLSNLEPFGMHNEKPLFSLDNAEISLISTVGAEGKHLRLKLFKNGKYINCIGFFLGSFADSLKQGDKINIAFHMDINHYQGNEQIQLIIKDIKRI
jgi:single-stranded-DNA-specific exonuclease